MLRTLRGRTQPSVHRENRLGLNFWDELSTNSTKGETMFAKAIIILLVLTPSARWASAQSTFGDVVGVVKDQNQGGVPGAQVLLTSVDDG
jgi:hypothetical protein